MKKAFRWLDAQNIDYQFHDYKRIGIDADTLAEWCKKADWETLLNKRGLTWRRLSDTDKQDVDEEKAIRLMVGSPSLIKRPVLEYHDYIEIGFSPARYSSIFNR